MRAKSLFVLLILFSLGYGQPKWNGYIGGGFYNPSLVGLDSDSNSVIPSSTTFNKNILLNWGFQYQFYPNARIGIMQFHSFHSGELGSSTFSRTLTYRMFPIETFFYLRKRIELNFTLAPMWNKGTIKLTAPSSNTDWDNILDSYGNASVSYDTESSMVKRWFGFSSTIGIKYYLFTWMAVDAKMGFIQNFYSEKNWKFAGKKVTGPKMDIKVLPVFNLHLVFGWS